MTQSIGEFLKRIWTREPEPKLESILPEEFPLLTEEMCNELAERLKYRVTNAEDCIIIDHYLTSAGVQEGYLEEALMAEGVYSFESIRKVFKTFNHKSFPPVVAIILNNIIFLRDCVLDGEKLY